MKLFRFPQAISPPVEFSNASGAAFTAVSSNADVGAVTVAEMVMTLFLTMVVSMGAVNGRTRCQFAPFLIGLTVTANILAGQAFLPFRQVILGIYYILFKQCPSLIQMSTKYLSVLPALRHMFGANKGVNNEVRSTRIVRHQGKCKIYMTLT